MRVAAFAELDGPSGVQLLERSPPEPAEKEAVVELEACAINRHDLWILNGDSAIVSPSELPFVSGLDVAGVVHEVGDSVTAVEPGERVVLCPIETCRNCEYCREGPEILCEQFSLFHGGLPELVRVRSDRLIPIPESVASVDAAALPTAYMTAYHMLRRAEIQPQDLVFVPGATGGVGVAAVQLGSIMVARTVGSSSSASKLFHVRALGLDHGIHSTDTDELAERVKELGFADAVINHLGGEFTELGQSVLKRNDTMVICGQTVGATAELNHPDLFLRHKRILGSTMGTQKDLERLLELVDGGRLSPDIYETFPLEETADAFELMDGRDSVGKIVIVP